MSESKSEDEAFRPVTGLRTVREEVGSATYESWPIGARMAIEQVETRVNEATGIGLGWQRKHGDLLHRYEGGGKAAPNFGPDLVSNALSFGFHAHAGQTRKYAQGPYIQHPIRVALRLSGLDAPEPVVAAALLHDVVEDCDVAIGEIAAKFGAYVARLVDDLTDRFTKAAHPTLNRRRRKNLEALRLAATSEWSRCIKLADIADNLRSIDPADGFARVYLEEKTHLLACLPRGEYAHQVLKDEVEEAGAALARSIEKAASPA